MSRKVSPRIGIAIATAAILHKDSSNILLSCRRYVCCMCEPSLCVCILRGPPMRQYLAVAIVLLLLPIASCIRKTLSVYNVLAHTHTHRPSAPLAVCLSFIFQTISYHFSYPFSLSLSCSLRIFRLCLITLSFPHSCACVCVCTYKSMRVCYVLYAGCVRVCCSVANFRLSTVFLFLRERVNEIKSKSFVFVCVFIYTFFLVCCLCAMAVAVVVAVKFGFDRSIDALAHSIPPPSSFLVFDCFLLFFTHFSLFSGFFVGFSHGNVH